MPTLALAHDEILNLAAPLAQRRAPGAPLPHDRPSAPARWINLCAPAKNQVWREAQRENVRWRPRFALAPTAPNPASCVLRDYSALSAELFQKPPERP